MKLATVVAAVLTTFGAPALAEEGPFLGISAGVGLSTVNSSGVAGGGTGAYGRADYLFWRDSWFTPALYTGLLLTRSDRDCGAGVVPCDVSSQLLFAGGRVRFMAPIPYVGPFVELGIGASLGHISTQSGAAADVRWTGATYHIPWAVGVAFGERHEWEIAFEYMVHPEQNQTNGAVAVGFGFRLPVRNESDGPTP
jgi:hypothetical protein